MLSIPECIDEISSDWLTRVLDREVTGCRVQDAHSDTTGRAVLALEQFGGDMPPVFTTMAQLYLANADAIHRLWNEGVPTLIHIIMVYI